MRERVIKAISIILVLVSLITIAPMEVSAARVNPTTMTKIYNNFQGVGVEWKKASNVDGYYVCRKTGKNGTWSKVGETTGLSYIDKTAKHNTYYYYKICAYKGNRPNRKFSSYCAEKAQRFVAAPEMVSAKERDDYVEVNYKAVKGAKYYYVHRKEGLNGTYKYIGKTTNSATFKDTNTYALEPKKTYYYMVKTKVNDVTSGRYAGKGCTVTCFATNCDHYKIHHKKVIKPTETLKGYTINYCKCELHYQISDIKNPTNLVQANPDLPAYSEAVKRDKASVDYLNKVYKNDKSDLIQVFNGSNDDIRVLKKFTDNIVAEETTYLGRAYAIYDWVLNNVEYCNYHKQHACDVMRFKKGDCLGMSNFVCDALKLQGIPAVVVTGYVGDTKNTFTINNMDDVSGGVGHAWVRALINYEWMLIDCTFERFITSKDDFDIPAWYYAIATDNIAPYYKGMNFKYTKIPVYIDGNYYVFTEEGDQLLGIGRMTRFVDNLTISYQFRARDPKLNGPRLEITQDYTDDGKEYLPGQALTSTRIYGKKTAQGYSDYDSQAYYNGREVGNTTFSFDGKNYIVSGNTFEYKDYSGKHLAMYSNGAALQPNETITLIPKIKYSSNKLTFKWTSSNPEVATVDQNGKITAKAEGITEIERNIIDDSGDEIYGPLMYIYVVGEEFIINDSDMAPQSAIARNRSKIQKPGPF